MPRASTAMMSSPFTVYGKERHTYGEVLARADALSSALATRFGVCKGDRCVSHRASCVPTTDACRLMKPVGAGYSLMGSVAIVMRNLPEFVVSYIAISNAGAVVVPMNAWWTGQVILYCCVWLGVLV